MLKKLNYKINITRYVSDTTATMMLLFVAVIWPKKNIFKQEKYEPLISWKDIVGTFPWGVIFLIGKLASLNFFFEEFQFTYEN